MVLVIGLMFAIMQREFMKILYAFFRQSLCSSLFFISHMPYSTYECIWIRLFYICCTYIYIHTYIHSYTHSYVHTHILTYLLLTYFNKNIYVYALFAYSFSIIILGISLCIYTSAYFPMFICVFYDLLGCWLFWFSIDLLVCLPICWLLVDFVSSLFPACCFKYLLVPSFMLFICVSS